MDEQWNPGIKESWHELTTAEVRNDVIAMVAEQNEIDVEEATSLVDEWIGSALANFGNDLDHTTKKAHQLARVKGITPPPEWEELGPEAQKLILALRGFAGGYREGKEVPVQKPELG